MSLYNVGSVVTDVSNYIGPANVPSALSGTSMNFLVVKNINYMNTFTNDSIGTTDIAEKYQPTLFSLTTADVLIAIESTAGGIDSATIGELSLSQGQGGLSELATQMRETATKELKELGRSLRFRRVIGG